MEKKLILVDSNLIIHAYRGDLKAKKKLEALRGRIVISIITEMEIFIGCKTQKKRSEFENQLKAYSRVNVDKYTMLQALALVKGYAHMNLQIADAIIAATALENNLDLETYNKKDFNFIKGIKFFGSRK